MDIRGSFLAPIHDYTDIAFRMLCRKHGADHCCIPLINALGIIRNPSLIENHLVHADEAGCGAQLVGDEPASISEALSLLEARHPFIGWFELNCGCPSARTMGDGGGAALLEAPERIGKIVRSMRSSSRKPISIKMRICRTLPDTMRIIRIAEEAGADFITVHGRTAGQGYGGSSDWDIIRSIKEASSIPIVGNGDISSLDDGFSRVMRGSCDAFMVGRKAISNPLIFSGREPDGLEERISLLEEYLGLCIRYGIDDSCKALKQKAMAFTKGLDNGAAIRCRIGPVRDQDALMDAISGFR